VLFRKGINDNVIGKGVEEDQKHRHPASSAIICCCESDGRK